MDVQMVGIDHSRASVGQREAFSFTRHRIAELMTQWKKTELFSGCVLLSTCNRTELWVSGKREDIDLQQLLLDASGVKADQAEGLFLCRREHEAMEHLFQLVCGLKSRIYGEDQIISQIRESLERSRTVRCNDMAIEKLFQTAIAAGKSVKERVKPGAAHPSAAGSCLQLLQQRFGTVKELPCLVIGNGQMGKLTALTLAKAGARVSMTLRKQFHGTDRQDSVFVRGCRMIEFEQRLTGIQQYRAVISATASPHYTVRAGELNRLQFQNCIWIDMAVPRDLEPAIGDISGIELYDMDRLGDESRRQDTERMEKEALVILKEYEEKLERWFRFREHTEQVKHIAALTGEDAGRRMPRQTPASLRSHTESSTEKAVRKILFGLRETLPQEHWEACFNALIQAAEKETVKTGSRRQQKERKLEKA